MEGGCKAKHHGASFWKSEKLILWAGYRARYSAKRAARFE